MCLGYLFHIAQYGKAELFQRFLDSFVCYFSFNQLTNEKLIYDSHLRYGQRGAVTVFAKFQCSW